MIDREYTLNRLKSRSITPQEFNYEILSAPPILSMFTLEDIQQLNYIATSAKYSAKLKEKYKAIDEIMNRRGFDKLVSGTNRIAYQPRFANNFIVKVAYDSVALKDSIREYKNQFLIKPFCTKVFEVTPCGTLGVFEKVNPITNRKEYISMAADIYRLLSEFIIGEYIIDDIGTEYFNNIGFRNGFGAVVLDFPYVYKIDGKKIWCTKPDYDDPTGYCNGPIDYDLGFNKLRCKKCGAVYKPFELAKKIEYDYEKQFINESEDITMKIRISGGSKGLKKQEIVTGDFRNPVHVIKSNKMNKKIEKQLEEEEKETQKTVNGVAAPVKEEVLEDDHDDSTNTVDEDSDKLVADDKIIIKPFTINEDSDGGDLGYDIDKDDNVDGLLEKINNLYYYADDNSEEKKDISIKICKMLKDIFVENIEVAMAMFANILRKKPIKDEVIKDFLNNNSCSVNNQFIKLLLLSDNYDIDVSLNDTECSDDQKLIFNFDTSIVKVKSDGAEEKRTKIVSKNIESEVDLDDIDIELNNDYDDDNEYDTDVDADENGIQDWEPTGLELVSGKILSKKDLFVNEKLGNVLVVENDEGGYFTINNKIVAIDHIDGRDVNEIVLVAKGWYEDAIEKIDSIKETPVGVIVPIPDTTEEDSGEED